jgi:heme peroxidase
MHGGRVVYYVIGDEVVSEPDYLCPARGGCPVAAAASESAPAPEVMGSPFKFGRLFDKAEIKPEQRQGIADCLVALGKCMSDPRECGGAAAAPSFSEIPAGYTYLGQFIAHEITSDRTEGLPLEALIPDNLRSPTFDLDSLYGDGPNAPAGEGDLYERANRARLRVGPTEATTAGLNKSFDNDLPRAEATGRALIGDPRNDQNLPVAQTHVALIRFHNRVVADLEDGYRRRLEPLPPADKLFEAAREQVVKHFQWIVLYDYLEEVVDADVLKAVRAGDLRLKRLKVGDGEGPFMPLEFSAAAFRIGHSMVRPNYQWNALQSDELGFGPATLGQLFAQTHFSNRSGALRRLPSDWVIDWRRFYDFREVGEQLGYGKNLPEPNMAGQIDTVFDLHLERIAGFDHQGLLNEKRLITVRNLLRGLAFSLPCGEEVARLLEEDALKYEELMKYGELTNGPHAPLLDAAPIKGQTPLWFYVLKEARERGTAGRLGRVGSRIVAETLYGLVRHSEHSILKDTDWRPAVYGRKVAGGVEFKMVDLLHAAGVVDPIGEHLKRLYQH